LINKYKSDNSIHKDEYGSPVFSDGTPVEIDLDHPIHNADGSVEYYITNLRNVRNPDSLGSTLKYLASDVKDYMMNHPGKVGMAAAGTAGLVGAGIAAKKYLSRRKK